MKPTAGQAYVQFLDRKSSGGPSPYSVEGYLAAVADFSAGAIRSRGWRRTVAKLTAWILLLPLLAAVVTGLIHLGQVLLGS